MTPAGYTDEPPRLKREPGVRLNPRRLLAGMSILLIVTGLLLVCSVQGLLNPVGFPGGPRWIELSRGEHRVGFVCLAIGAVGLVFLFSLEKCE